MGLGKHDPEERNPLPSATSPLHGHSLWSRTKPTREDNTLDLICTNMIPWVETIPGLADHDIVYAELQLNPVRARPTKRRIACYNQADWARMRTATAELTASILSVYTEDSHIEVIWTTWKDSLTEQVQQYIPHRTTGPKHDLPWVDCELKKLIRRRNRIHKKWKKTGREELYTAFWALKRKV